MTQPTSKNDDPPEHHIHHTLENIRKLAAGSPNQTATNEMIHRFAFLLSKLSEVSSNNAAKQELIALHANQLTKENLQLQSKVVGLTLALLLLTIFLTIVAGIQILYLVRGNAI